MKEEVVCEVASILSSSTSRLEVVVATTEAMNFMILRLSRRESVGSEKTLSFDDGTLIDQY